jgi:phage replication O-like protein O
MLKKIKETDLYTPIHNEVLEALARINLSPYETRVLMATWRKTYGFRDTKTGLRKKYDRISLSQFNEMTGLDRRLASRALQGLKKKGVIVRNGYEQTGFSKAFMKKLGPMVGVPRISQPVGDLKRISTGIETAGQIIKRRQKKYA